MVPDANVRIIHFVLALLFVICAYIGEILLTYKLGFHLFFTNKNRHCKNDLSQPIAVAVRKYNWRLIQFHVERVYMKFDCWINKISIVHIELPSVFVFNFSFLTKKKHARLIIHTGKYFLNHVKSTVIRLYLLFSDWFGTEQNSVKLQVNWKMVNAI